MLKSTLLIGGATYAVLGILAIVFYKERMAFLDSSFILFSILKEGNFAIQVNRFGACLTQIFPLAGSKLGLSLNNIMKVYSLGFIVYYFSLFYVCVGVFKKYRFGLCLLLFNVLMVAHTFYWVMNEFIQGIALMIVFFAFLSRMDETNLKDKSWCFLVKILSLLTLAFIHPLLIIPFAFATVYFYYFRHIERKSLINSSIIFLVFVVTKNIFFRSAYDSSAMGGLKNFLSLFPNYFSIESNKMFLTYLIYDYYLLIPLLGIIIYYFVKQKLKYPLYFIPASFIGYLFLINVSFKDGPDQFYIESLYLPLSLFLIIPFVFEIIPKLKLNQAIVGLSFTCLIRVLHIYGSHQPYSNRVSYLNSILDKTANNPNKKMILATKNMAMDTLMMSWGSPYEFWLLSTINTGESRSILIIETPSKYNWALGQKDEFITDWGLFKYDQLPNKYFNFRDTSQYQIKH